MPERITVAEFRYFLAVVASGSFGRASRSMQLSVSTLSRAVTRLEDRLGTTLLERTPTGIRVTASGRIALRGIRRVLNETNALTESLEGRLDSEKSEIHLGFHLPPVNSVITNLLLDWRISHPNVSIIPYEQADNALLRDLTHHRIDVALVPNYLLSHHEARTPLYSEPIVAVLPEYHGLAHKKALQWNDLENEDLLLWAWAKDGIGRNFFACRLPRANVHVFETGNMTTLAFVQAGYGISIVAQAYSTLKIPGLVFIPIKEANAYLEINLVWLPETEDPIVGNFVAFMRDRARGHRRSPNFRVASETPCLHP